MSTKASIKYDLPCITGGLKSHAWQAAARPAAVRTAPAPPRVRQRPARRTRRLRRCLEPRLCRLQTLWSAGPRSHPSAAVMSSQTRLHPALTLTPTRTLVLIYTLRLEMLQSSWHAVSVTHSLLLLIPIAVSASAVLVALTTGNVQAMLHVYSTSPTTIIRISTIPCCMRSGGGIKQAQECCTS